MDERANGRKSEWKEERIKERANGIRAALLIYGMKR
jgi:hypothetical protein